MKQFIALAIGLALLTPATMAQEVTITDFPVGVGADAGVEIFRPHFDRLQTVADTLRAYPEARAHVIGSADGARFRSNNDALNPGLALGRAHALVHLLIHRFGVDSSQLVIRTVDVPDKGGPFRSVSVRIDRSLIDFASRISSLESRPAVERQIETASAPLVLPERLRLYVGGGATTSPFGGVPVVVAGLSWERTVTVEGMLGHTFWNSEFGYQNLSLKTKHRLAAILFGYYPFEDKPVGVVAGWIRYEDISQKYYEYVRLSEGLLLGLRAMPRDFLTVTAAYNPSKHRELGSDRSEYKNGQFLFSITAQLGFGGVK